MAGGWQPGEMLQEWLEASTYPARVRENYHHHAGRWLAHCDETGLAWDKVAAQRIALWAHRPGAPHSSTARRISAVRSFYAYSLRRNAVVYNPAARTPRLTNPAQLTPSRLDPWQTAVLLAALDDRRRADSPHPRLDRACGYLMVGLALRSSEILRITLDDLTTTDGFADGPDTLRLPDPAGWDREILPPRLIRAAIAAYLPHRRPPRHTAHGGPLFTTRAGIKLPHRYPGDLLREVATARGLLRTTAEPQPTA